MQTLQYDAARTALLVFDPYNDFLSEGGKISDRFRTVLEENHVVEHLVSLIDAARTAGIQVVFVPHRRWRTGDFDSWAFPNNSQIERMTTHTFEDGTWGGTFRDDLQPELGDIVATEHWAQNGFVNTDLAIQLNQHGITHIIEVGMVANTCLEASGRYAMELGYHVTLVTDATGAPNAEALHAAHVINGPSYAHAITTTAALLDEFRVINACHDAAAKADAVSSDR